MRTGLFGVVVMRDSDRRCWLESDAPDIDLSIDEDDDF